MNPARDPSAEQMARAFTQIRLGTWPWPTFEALQAAKNEIDRAYLLVRARAVSMTNGQVMPPAPVPVASPPSAPVKAVQTPALQPRRRRDDDGFDPKLAQSGEYVHHDDE